MKLTLSEKMFGYMHNLMDEKMTTNIAKRLKFLLYSSFIYHIKNILKEINDLVL